MKEIKKPQNWGQICPNYNCNCYGKNSQGSIRSVASYLTRSGKRRIFECKVCGEMFSETRDTVFHDLRTSEEKVMMALKMILVKVDLSGISFVRAHSRFVEDAIKPLQNEQKIYSSFFGRFFYIKEQKPISIRVLTTTEHLFGIYFSIFWECTLQLYVRNFYRLL